MVVPGLRSDSSCGVGKLGQRETAWRRRCQSVFPPGGMPLQGLIRRCTSGCRTPWDSPECRRDEPGARNERGGAGGAVRATRSRRATERCAPAGPQSEERPPHAGWQQATHCPHVLTVEGAAVSRGPRRGGRFPAGTPPSLAPAALTLKVDLSTVSSDAVTAGCRAARGEPQLVALGGGSSAGPRRGRPPRGRDACRSRQQLQPAVRSARLGPLTLRHAAPKLIGPNVVAGCRIAHPVVVPPLV